MFYAYPSTKGFPEIVANIKRQSSFAGFDPEGNPIYLQDYNCPTIKFKQTIKLHGTNAGVSLERSGKLSVQSRNRLLSLESDNAGFYAFVMIREDLFRSYLQNLLDQNEDKDAVVLFGEYAGSNIQKGVALTQIEKTFFPFAVAFVKDEQLEFVENPELLDSKERNVYSIDNFEHKEIDIDFNNPEVYQNQLVEEVDKIDKVCPVGKYFGVEGHGEGVVLVGYHNGQRLSFKVKGDAHSTSKVRTLKDVDIVAYKQIEEFGKSLISERRLEQGIEYLKEMNIPLTIKSTGDFIKWINQDIIKEEQLVLEKSGYDWKKVQGITSKVAVSWFKQKLIELS